MGKLKMQNEVREKVGISPRSEGSAQKPSNEGQTSRVQLRALPYAEQVQRLAPEENAAPVGGGTLDETTVERWIQSALNLLLGAGLNVDGMLSRSRAQIRAFQTKAPELTGTKLAVDGLAGPRTIGALEDATGGAAPATTEAQQKKAAKSEKSSGADENGAEGADAKHEGVVEDVDPGADAKVEQDVKAEIDQAAAKSKSDDAKVDVSQAYDQAKAWTMGQQTSLETKRAKAVKTKLDMKWAAADKAYNDWVAGGRVPPKRGKPPEPPGDHDVYVNANWFREYWSLWCYQFAQKVSEFLDGSKSAGLARLVSQTEKASTGGGDVAAVKGRTTLHRGKTLNQMALDEKGNPRLAPGASVHVKLHWEGDNPYEFKDDFHHWMVYAGNGKLSDTLTGKDKSGSSMDAAMKGWVRKSFKMADCTPTRASRRRRRTACRSRRRICSRWSPPSTTRA